MSIPESTLTLSLDEPCDLKLPSPYVKPRGEFKAFTFAKQLTRQTTLDSPLTEGSIKDLEGLTNKILYERDTYQGSTPSTNPTSRISLESRSLTRNLSLDPELETIIEDSTPKFVLNSEKHLSQTSQLNFKQVCAHSIIFEDEDKEIHRSRTSFAELLNEEDEKARDVTQDSETASWHIYPEFSSNTNLASSLVFDDENHKVTHLTSKRFSTVYASHPLPSSGKCEFSVCIESSSKVCPKLYIGVASSESKGNPLSYKPGFTFISAFSGESYLNGLRKVSEDKLPKQNQVVTVSLDLDSAWICFEVEKQKILEGKLNLPKKKAEFYPFVALGEHGGSVSFV